MSLLRVLGSRVGVRGSSRVVRSAMSASSWRTLASEAGSGNDDQNQSPRASETDPVITTQDTRPRQTDKLLSFASLAAMKDKKDNENNAAREVPDANTKGKVEFRGKTKASRANGKQGKNWNKRYKEQDKKKEKDKDTETTQQDGDEGEVTRPKVRTFSFAPSASVRDDEIEQFEYPAYYDEDFPADFDNKMKMEVEKFEIFSDYVFFMDESWQEQIHPLFDGKPITLTVNCPLEDFNERLFIEDRTTYDTKVVMEVPLKCFTGLSPQGLEYLIQLVGPRYNANKKVIKLTEDRYRTRVHNHKRLCDILHDLTQTADELSKADLVETTEATPVADTSA